MHRRSSTGLHNYATTGVRRVLSHWRLETLNLVSDAWHLLAAHSWLCIFLVSIVFGQSIKSQTCPECRTQGKQARSTSVRPDLSPQRNYARHQGIKWRSQMESCWSRWLQVSIINATLYYGFEYLGNSDSALAYFGGSSWGVLGRGHNDDSLC